MKTRAHHRRAATLAFAVAALAGGSGAAAFAGLAPASGNTPPNTTITSGLVSPGTATFSFTSNEPESAFECRLEPDAGGVWSPCASPVTFSGLSHAVTYTFKVRAVDSSYAVDPTPAMYGPWQAAPDRTTAVTSPAGAAGTGTTARPSDTATTRVTNNSDETVTVSIDEDDTNDPTVACGPFDDCVGQLVTFTISSGTSTATAARRPGGDARYPYLIRVRWDSSVLAGKKLKRFVVLHDGDVVPKCTPKRRRHLRECVIERTKFADGDFQVVFETTENGRVRGR